MTWLLPWRARAAMAVRDLADVALKLDEADSPKEMAARLVSALLAVRPVPEAHELDPADTLALAWTKHLATSLAMARRFMALEDPTEADGLALGITVGRLLVTPDIRVGASMMVLTGPFGTTPIVGVTIRNAGLLAVQIKGAGFELGVPGTTAVSMDGAGVDGRQVIPSRLEPGDEIAVRFDVDELRDVRRHGGIRKAFADTGAHGRYRGEPDQSVRNYLEAPG